MSDRPVAGDGGAGSARGRRPFVVGDWTVDPSADEIVRGLEVVKLEPRHMLLLVVLAERAGQVVTIDELLDRVWPGVVVTQNSVYQSVAQLRKTLGNSQAPAEYIATVPRKGYRLIARVDDVAAATTQDATVPAAGPSAAPAPASAESPSASPPVAMSPPETGSPRSARRRTVVAGSVAAASAIAAVGWWGWRRLAAPSGPVRLAVLPFADRSEGHLEQAAADGLANDVIHRFERSAGLRVLARNSSFTFRQGGDALAPLAEIRRQLSADYALVGELFRARTQVRVATRLLAVASGKTTWSDTFERPDDRLAELPGAIAAAALNTLGLPDVRPPELNPLAAYELYLLGLNALQTQRTVEGIAKARDYFQHAIDTDATYARAYAGLASTWLAQFNYGVGISARDAGARAQPLIDKALALDPNMLEALLAQARLYSLTNWGEASRSRPFAQKAVDLYPGSAEARYALGTADAFDAKPLAAMKQYPIAASLDPLNFVVQSRWGQDATFAGEYDVARAHFEQAAVLAPKHPWRFLGPAQTDYAQGRLDEAVLGYRRQFEIDPRRANAWYELGHFYLELGMPAQAREAFVRKGQLFGDDGAEPIDVGMTMLAEGRQSEVVAKLDGLGAGRRSSGPVEIDRLTMYAMSGRDPDAATIEETIAAMQADKATWVGSYWIFLGWFAWIDLAALALRAGLDARATSLLADAQAMLDRLRANGNAFCTIPFLEARIAALRGRPDDAIAKLRIAVDAGWRHAWLLPFDIALTGLRGDARLTDLVSRVRRDLDPQRVRLLAELH